MSFDIKGGIEYALTKRHYDADDNVVFRHPTTGVPLMIGLPFTDTPTFYVSGMLAYLADPTVYDPLKGWCLYTHGQPAPPPTFTAPVVAVIGAIYTATLMAAWPAAIPAFEAKRTTFLATEDCWVHFEGPIRVSQYIPGGTLAAGPYFTWNRRWFIIWVERVTTNGTLYAWIEG